MEQEAPRTGAAAARGVLPPFARALVAVEGLVRAVVAALVTAFAEPPPPRPALRRRV